MAEHRRLGFDPADPPAQYPKAVDHRRVRVGPNQGVRVGEKAVVGVPRVDDPGDVLEIHLMADAGRGRDYPEVVESSLPPLEELVPLEVPFELPLGIHLESHPVTECIDLDRVVDHQVDVYQRVDRRRLTPDRLHRIPHRGQVDHGRNPGEILHQDPGRLERDLLGRLGGRVPPRYRLGVRRGDGHPVFESEDVLEQDLERVGQRVDREAIGQGTDPVDPVRRSACQELCRRSECVLHRFHPVIWLPV